MAVGDTKLFKRQNIGELGEKTEKYWGERRKWSAAGERETEKKYWRGEGEVLKKREKEDLRESGENRDKEKEWKEEKQRIQSSERVRREN